MAIKEWLKRFVPATKREFQEQIKNVNRELAELNDKAAGTNTQLKELGTREHSLNEALTQIREQTERNEAFIKTLSAGISDSNAQIEHQYSTLLKELGTREHSLNEALTQIREQTERNEALIKTLSDGNTDYLKQLMNHERFIRRYAQENNWADVFHDAIIDSDWLIHKDFYPGRWAIGYQTLYVLFRILNEVKPGSILELGLGQSTKLITQYAMSNQAVGHVVIEHDENWIGIFEKTVKLAPNTRILKKNLTFENWNDTDNIRVYEDFAVGISPAKYDLIVIDGPWGGDMKIFSRIDVARLLPGCLSSSFVILMDDYNRSGEKATIEYMKTLLEENNIGYKTAKYEGAKDAAVIVSEDLAYICTL